MKKNSLKEKYLIFKVKQSKDPDAYGTLYDYYVDRIYRFVFFKVNSQEDAEDITAEVFLKTWQYIRNTDQRIENMNALLYRMARNAVIDYYRNKRRTEVQLSEQEQFLRIMEARSLEEKIDARLKLDKIHELLNHIKDEYRDVILLRHVEGFSINEIATILEKKNSTVRVLLHRGVKRLNELIGEE